MYNVSGIGRKTVNPYSALSKNSKTLAVNPFFQEDTFTISDDAMILSAALNEVKAALNNEMSKLDEDKINELKKQIADGSYNVSSADVAARLLAD